MKEIIFSEGKDMEIAVKNKVTGKIGYIDFTTLASGIAEVIFQVLDEEKANLSEV